MGMMFRMHKSTSVVCCVVLPFFISFRLSRLNQSKFEGEKYIDRDILYPRSRGRNKWGTRWSNSQSVKLSREESQILPVAWSKTNNFGWQKYSTSVSDIKSEMRYDLFNAIEHPVLANTFLLQLWWLASALQCYVCTVKHTAAALFAFFGPRARPLWRWQPF